MVASMEGEQRRRLTFEEVAAVMTHRGMTITPKQARAVHSQAMKKLRARLYDTLLEKVANRECDPDDEG